MKRKALYILIFCVSLLLVVGVIIYSVPILAGGFFAPDKVHRLVRVTYSVPFVLLAMYLANVGANVRDNRKWWILDSR